MGPPSAFPIDTAKNETKMEIEKTLAIHPGIM